MTPGICQKCGKTISNQGALKMHLKSCKGKPGDGNKGDLFTEPPTAPAPDRRNAEHLPAVQPAGTTPAPTKKDKKDKKNPDSKGFWAGIEEDLNA